MSGALSDIIAPGGSKGYLSGVFNIMVIERAIDLHVCKIYIIMSDAVDSFQQEGGEPVWN